MLVKRLVLIGAGAALVLGGTAVALDSVARQPSAPLAASSPATQDGSTTAASPPSGGSSGVASPGAATGGNGQDGSSTQPNPSATGDANAPAPRVLEVLPPVSTPTGLPQPTAPTALVRAPLPASALEKGKLVAGFPADVLAFPEKTAIVFTAVSSDGNKLQATGEGIVVLTQDQLAGYFQQALQGKGFISETAQSAVPGESAIRLVRGTDSVSLTFATTGTGSTRFHLLGSFTAGPAA